MFIETEFYFGRFLFIYLYTFLIFTDVLDINIKNDAASGVNKINYYL